MPPLRPAGHRGILLQLGRLDDAHTVADLLHIVIATHPVWVQINGLEAHRVTQLFCQVH